MNFVFGMLLVSIHGLQSREVDGGLEVRGHKKGIILFFFYMQGRMKIVFKSSSFSSWGESGKGECGKQWIAVQNCFL